MSRRRSTWRVCATPHQMRAIAAKVLDERQNALAHEYELTASSGIWRRANGTFTVKLVYRNRHADRPATVSFTIRNVSHHAMLSAGQAG